EQLGYDLDELSDRLSPQKVAGRTVHGVKAKVSDAGSALKPKIAEEAAVGRAKAASLTTAGRDKARENPRAVGSAAGGLAALGFLTVLVSRRRRRGQGAAAPGLPGCRGDC
ncbi:DUF3618 domain-containing protein, partial [Frankia sp. EI5c]|uniref:DUF3618 domain-containing protein n=1 Tax=Frankia sp. EI5c TaxID=683316 RepID=UPI001F5B91FF